MCIHEKFKLALLKRRISVHVLIVTVQGSSKGEQQR